MTSCWMGLSRAMPVFFDDVTEVLRLCAGGALVIVSICCDRASANFRACAWLWKQMDLPQLRRCILPHFEPCALHGVSLVKCRAKGGKALIAAMASLGCLMKQQRFAGQLRLEILHQVGSRLRVVRAPRPAGCSARAERLARILFAADTDDWLHRTSSSGERYKSQLLLDLEALCAAVDFGSVAEELTHYCCVQEGDAAHAAGATPGDACCRSREESVEQVAAPLIQWFCHKSWEQSDNRWTKSVNLLRRVLTGCLAQRILPESLRGMQTSWKVHEGIAAQLERLVRANADDFSSRNKLRLLRICRVLCPPDAASDTAITLHCLLAVDPILYDLLNKGGAPDQAHASLADLCSWDRNPISSAQNRIVASLQDWGEEGQVWCALTSVGCRFDDTRCALKAKAELLALSAALVDHFELRMGAPPYSLIRLISAGASPEDKARCVDTFLRTPEHCLTEFCRRLRMLFPTMDRMLKHGPSIIAAWVQGSFLDIGRTERSHGLMRQELHSEHRARSFTASANHSVCQELRSAHIQRGGTDPLKTGVAPIAKALGVSPGEKRKNGLGGRRLPSWLAFRNDQFKRYKKTLADRPMTTFEMEQLQDKCSSRWHAMGEAEHEAWNGVAEAKHLLAISAPPAGRALVERQEPPVFEPWAGCGCEAHPIEAAAIADDLRSFRKAVQRRLAFDDPALSVGGAPIRASALPPGTEVQHTMWGCSASKLVCRATLPRSMAAALDIIVHKMHRWVLALGAEVVQQAESLVCFRGAHPTTGERRDIIALLIFSRQLPVIHFYAMCDIKGVPPAGAAPERMPDDLPFVASIRVVPSRMSKHWASVCIKTNEELALEMAKTHMDWNIVPLQWRLQEGASPLLDHVVLKIDDAFDPKAKVPRALAEEATRFIDQLIVGSDPVAAGIRAAADAMASGASRGRRGAAPNDSIAAGGEAQVEAELFADLPLDVLDDVHLELFGESLPLDDLGAPPSDDDFLAGEDDAAEEAAEAGEAPEGDEPPEAGGAPGPDAIDEAIAHCHVDRKTDVVTCDLAPWNALEKLGRITTWPRPQKDKQLRSISCLCYMHSSCQSSARVVRKCRRDTLLRWLLMGKIVYPAASWGERRLWGDCHKPGFLSISHFAPPPSPPGEDFLSSEGESGVPPAEV